MTKRIIAFLAVALLLLSLVGCSGSEQRKAKSLYKKGEYTAALEIFQALGNEEMALKCRIGYANAMMEKGDYAQAAQYYGELGNYENSAALYRKARLYQLWQYILDHGKTYSDGTRTISGTFDSKGIFLNADKEYPGTIYLFFHDEKHILADFTYDMILRMEAGQDLVSVTAEHDAKISIGGSDSTINSTYQGYFDLTSFTRSKQITLTAYNQVGVDMHGKATSSQKLEDAPTEDLHSNLYVLIDGAAQLIELTGTGITLRDLGFAVWE